MVVTHLEANDFRRARRAGLRQGPPAALRGAARPRRGRDRVAAYERSKQQLGEPSLVPKSRLEMAPGARQAALALGRRRRGAVPRWPRHWSRTCREHGLPLPMAGTAPGRTRRAGSRRGAGSGGAVPRRTRQSRPAAAPAAGDAQTPARATAAPLRAEPPRRRRAAARPGQPAAEVRRRFLGRDLRRLRQGRALRPRQGRHRAHAHRRPRRSA